MADNRYPILYSAVNYFRQYKTYSIRAYLKGLTDHHSIGMMSKENFEDPIGNLEENKSTTESSNNEALTALK